MGWAKKTLLAVDFLVFFAAGFYFIIFNDGMANLVSIAAGLLTIPITAFFFRDELVQDFRSVAIPLSLLASSLLILVFLFAVIDQGWLRFLPYILVSPVIIEEFNFRYVLQRILLRGLQEYVSVLAQAVVYVLYYSKYVVADHGAGFPFPYNVLMLTSVLGMGLIYGMVTKLSKNFILSATIHFTLWGLFPILAHFPGIASTLLPT